MSLQNSKINSVFINFVTLSDIKTLILMKNIFLFIGSLLLLNISVSGQESTMEVTLKYLNEKFAGKCSIEVVNKVLTAKFFDGEKLFREDNVSLKELDVNGIGYDANGKIFFVACKQGLSDCVSRILYVNKISRGYGRLSFPIALDEKGVADMTKAFTDMIKFATDKKHKNNNPPKLY